MSQTKKLILKLSQNPNVVLGIATGRNYANLDVIQELLPCFKYLVLVNGALVLEDNKVIDEHPIPVNYIENVVKQIKLYSGFKILASGVSMNGSAFFSNDNSKQLEIIKHWTKKFDIKIDNQFYLKEKVFMLNIFGDDREKIKPFLDKLDYFQGYYWHTHIDLTMKTINKLHGIQQIKPKYNDYELICVGDGCNDKEMLEFADIGIAMGNCEYIDVRKKANLISDHIMENTMYDFFIKNNLV